MVREMFAPSVTAGLLKPADLAGYRNGQVYIRKSMHVPLNRDAVRDAMPAFFDLLREEPHPGRPRRARAFCLRLHPSLHGRQRPHGTVPDEPMMASGGYPWTVIPVTDRNAYMAALEKASVGEDIGPSRISSPAWLRSGWRASRCRRCRSIHDKLVNDHFGISGLGD